MTNYTDNEDRLLEQDKIERVIKFKYLEQSTHLKDTHKKKTTLNLC